ncbi:MAG: response regulator [Chromatiales bacterium]|nr:response regulator [Chromatiales bacterium]
MIHVVDDDESLRSALQRLLDGGGLSTCTDLRLGRRFPAATPPADAPGCLLLDLRMPGPSGLDLQEALAAPGHPAAGDLPHRPRRPGRPACGR